MLRGIVLDPLCLVVDYCDGGSLYNYLQKEKDNITFEQKIKFMKEIIKGMIHLHTRLEQELIHRDL